MCVLDVAFNALLIPRLGVFGAGLGTMLACAVVAVVMVILCCREMKACASAAASTIRSTARF